MLSPIVPYSLLKMHWNAEHAQPISQWPEQHLDVSSTTSSPAHKSELYGAGGGRGPHGGHGGSGGRGAGGAYSYAWANDDISALTASNLLKRYAEKYSGMLDSPYERVGPAVGAYAETPGPAAVAAAAFGSLNGVQKTELEPWPLSHGSDGSYPLVPGSHDGLGGGPKVVTPASVVGPPGGSSVNSSLSDSAYSGSSSCSGPHSSDYPPTYNGTYLSSGYCPQPGSALTPTSLHALQPAPTLVPSYTPSTPVYNYPPSTYPHPHQAGLAPSYSHPAPPYLPSGLAAPTPLPSRPTVVGGSYGYQTTGVLGGGSDTGSGGSLKRKAFEMSLEDTEDGTDGSSRYRKYSYDAMKPGDDTSSPYISVGDKAGNGFGTSASDPQQQQQQQGFKPSKPSSQAAEDMGKYSGLKPLVSPQYGAGGGDYSPPAAMTGENGRSGSSGGDQGFNTQHRSSSSLKQQQRSSSTCGEGGVLKSAEPHILDLVTGELQDCGPALLWGELAGHVHLKAELEEELLWPALRPNSGGGGGNGAGQRAPRTVLLFGPRGGGKTTLARSLASQLGATLYRLSAAALVGKWKSEAEQVLGTLLAVASARAPALVYISELEALEDSDAGGVRQQLLSALEKAQHGGHDHHHHHQQQLFLVCSTRRPDLLKEPLLRCFAKRYHVGLPDAAARRQVLLQALAGGLGGVGVELSDREMAAVLQRSEGFTVCQLLQLCQQAASSANANATSGVHGHGLGGALGAPLAPLASPAFKDFENAFCKVRPPHSNSNSNSSPKEMDTCMEWSKVYSH
ncbi:fidgetin-like protein 2 [Engraulis encrasicolus]|uniref:fidgetin-like protein 2 n=1 Tax=Engraulis encrasicolus TaxID=184585 RepID=UPI002FCF0681